MPVVYLGSDPKKQIERGGVANREERKASEGCTNEQVTAMATGARLTAQNTPPILARGQGSRGIYPQGLRATPEVGILWGLWPAGTCSHSRKHLQAEAKKAVLR